MSILREELSERFNALIELKEPEGFFLVFIEYLRFIQETPPLPSIARSTFSDRLCLEVGHFYKTIQNAPFVEAKMLWADTHRQVLGLQREYDTGLFGFMMNMPLVRAQVRLFHSAMLEGLTHSRVGVKTILVIKTKEAAICSSGENERCYVMKRGEKQQRFQMIMILLRGNASASALAKRLDKEPTRFTQTNLKNEIAQINKNFRGNLRTEDNLIVSKKQRAKNIYSLNTEIFDFRTAS